MNQGVGIRRLYLRCQDNALYVLFARPESTTFVRLFVATLLMSSPLCWLSTVKKHWDFM
jgi:hypothetical protein